MLSSLHKLSSKLNKDQLRETRKYLEPFFIEQRNHPQTNNMIEGGEMGEAMHVHEDYRNNSYPPLTLTPDQEQQVEEDTKRSLPIWICGVLWTIPRTTVTSQRRLH